MIFEYNAIVKRVIDGDTAEVVVDLGFKIHHEITLRFNDIDCPETRTKDLVEKEAGIKAKSFVVNRIQGKSVIVRTYSNRANIYARWTADIYYKDDLGVEYSIVEQLKEFGFEK